MSDMSMTDQVWNKLKSDSAAAPTGRPDTTHAGAVDVEHELDEAAKRVKSEGGHEWEWRTSVVDLLNLLEVDSGVIALERLAGELHVSVGDIDGELDGEQNRVVYSALLGDLARRGLIVSDSLKSMKVPAEPSAKPAPKSETREVATTKAG